MPLADEISYTKPKYVAQPQATIFLYNYGTMCHRTRINTGVVLPKKI